MKTSGLKFLKGEISSSRNISHMLAVPKGTLQAKYVQTETGMYKLSIVSKEYSIITRFNILP